MGFDLQNHARRRLKHSIWNYHYVISAEQSTWFSCQTCLCVLPFQLCSFPWTDCTKVICGCSLETKSLTKGNDSTPHTIKLNSSHSYPVKARSMLGKNLQAGSLILKPVQKSTLVKVGHTATSNTIHKSLQGSWKRKNHFIPDMMHSRGNPFHSAIVISRTPH